MLVCYRCEVCATVSRPGVAKLRHLLLRKNGDIAKEITCCGECHKKLGVGDVTVQQLKDRYSTSEDVAGSWVGKQNKYLPE